MSNNQAWKEMQYYMIVILQCLLTENVQGHCGTQSQLPIVTRNWWTYCNLASSPGSLIFSIFHEKSFKRGSLVAKSHEARHKQLKFSNVSNKHFKLKEATKID